MTKAQGAADQVAGADQPKITRQSFVQVPIPLLEACDDHKSTLFIYAWLWHYAGQDDQALPTINLLAVQCRMHPDNVRRGLRWLVENGWISRVDGPGKHHSFTLNKGKP